ncbi:unnamed protein product, partial [Prorocentrum cordatum]
VLRSTAAVARRAYPTEKLRPATSATRRARRAIAEQVKQPSSPASKPARSMCAQPVPKLVMEASRLHVNQSIEDETATTAFRIISGSFESHFDKLFEDARQWEVVVLSDIADRADGGYMRLQTYFAGMGLLFAGVYSALTVGKSMIAAVRWECAGSTGLWTGNLLLEELNRPVKVSGAAEDDAARARRGLVVAELKACKERTRKILDGMPRFFQTLGDMHARLLKSRNLARQRMGDISMTEMGEGHKAMGLVMYDSAPHHVQSRITDMTIYLRYCIDHAGSQANGMAADRRDEFTGGMIKFAGLQRFTVGSCWSNFSDSSVEALATDGGHVDMIRNAFAEFKDYV